MRLPCGGWLAFFCLALLLFSCGGRSDLFWEQPEEGASNSAGVGGDRADGDADFDSGGATFAGGAAFISGGGPGVAIPTTGGQSAGGSGGTAGELGAGGAEPAPQMCGGADDDGDGVANDCDACSGFDDNDPRVVSGDVQVTTQAELEALSGVVEFSGSLTIGYPNNVPSVTSLAPLSCLQTVSGDFVIRANAIPHLHDLSLLTSVGGDLKLINNDDLETLDGLGALTSVGGELSIEGHSSLRSVDGLTLLTTVGGSLNVGSNAVLIDLDGFMSLREIGGWLHLHNHGALR